MFTKPWPHLELAGFPRGKRQVSTGTGFKSLVFACGLWLLLPAVLAQAQLSEPPTAEGRTVPPTTDPPSQEDLPRPDIFEPITPPEELLQTLPTPPPPLPGPDIPESIRINGFEFIGNTVFDDATLAQAVEDALGERFLDEDISFTELYRIRTVITEFYAAQGYVTSAAIIPPQELQSDGDILTVEVVEGGLGSIQVSTSGKLNPDYVRSRLARATAPPLQVDDLLEELQLLQLDPLIQRVSAEISAGSQLGTTVLSVNVEEADSAWVDFRADNARSPSVGSLQQMATFTEANLLGNGEQLTIGLNRSSGLNAISASYRFFLNPRNGMLSLSTGFTGSEVVEDPFDILEIESDALFYELAWKQPIRQSPSEEINLGLTFSSQGSRSIFLREFFGEAVGFPTRGADDEGRSRITALRFSQEWTQQYPRQALALRSQFSLGLDILGATSSGDPDSQFFAWRGQGQWVKQLTPTTLLILQGDAQLADSPLLPLEQFGIGGPNNVRGYRQDLLLVDNGITASAELRYPLYRSLDRSTALQLTPFIEGGYGWNADGRTTAADGLLSLGVGLIWQTQSGLSARLDWGLPLINGDIGGNSLQENGIHFAVNYRAF